MFIKHGQLLLYIYIYIFDNGGRLKIKLYDKRVDFSFRIVNIPFISSNIPVSPTYGVYIAQLIRYSSDCAKYSDFLDRTRLLTQRLFKQGYVATRLKLSLQKFYSRHHNLVGRYKISISLMTMDLFTFYAYVLFPLSLLRLLPDLTVYMIRGCHIRRKICLPFAST